ncbi:MAG: T9SS type A sorting domain-containing protein [Janthinobacterium lividum]
MNLLLQLAARLRPGRVGRRGTGLALALGTALAAQASAGPGLPPLAAPAQVARTAAAGTFGTATAYSTGTTPAGTYPAAVAVADFNLDGFLDVVTANLSDNTVTVLLNTGTGTYPSPGVTYATGDSPLAVATGDFNKDGYPDIVTANANSRQVTSGTTLPNAGTITVLLNSGSGTFVTSGTYGTGASSLTTSSATTPVSTASPAGVAVGLLNTDTYPDIVVTNADGGTVGVFLNTGTGTFPSAATLYTVGSYPIGVALGDFNLDGRPDIVTANSLGNTISVLLNTGTGTFGTQVAYAVGSEPSAVAVGLLNADTYPDIVVANTSGNTVSVVLNTGTGTFPSSSTAYAVGSSPGAVVVADLDVDGDVDIAAANGNGNTLSVLLNAGTGTFGTQTAYATGSAPTGIATGLLSADTAPDLVTTNGLDNTISVLLGTATTLPVQLTAFTAVKKAADGLLSWTTASEANSAYFEVQASPDGSTWQVLGQVAAAGSSSTVRTYSFLDQAIARYGVPLVYYRLRQVDQDGTSAFSPVRTLAPDALAWAISAYPNPSAGELSVQLTTGETGPVKVSVYDVRGTVLLQSELAGSLGTQLLELPGASALAAGTYLLRVQQGAHTSTVRFSRE